MAPQRLVRRDGGLSDVAPAHLQSQLTFVWFGMGRGVSCYRSIR